MNTEPVAVPVKETSTGSSVSQKVSPPKDTNVSSGVEPSPLLHEKPFVAIHYGIDNVWSDLSPDLQDAGETIMEYYRQQVGQKKLADSKEAFQDFMKRLERTTDTRNAPTETKLRVISEFIRYLTRIQPYK